MSKLTRLIFVNVAFILLVWKQGTCQKFELGGAIGVTNYKGDVSVGLNPQNTSYGVGLISRVNFNPYVSWRNSLSYGKLEGKDNVSGNPMQEKRLYSFTLTTTEFHSLIEYHFFQFRGKKRGYKFSPYLMFGLGLALHSDFEASYQGESFVRQSETNMILPFGVGIKHELGRKFNISLELLASKGFTDQLDGIDDSTQLPLSQSAHASNLDINMYLSFGVTYRFIGIRCPKHYKYMPPNDF